MKKVLSHTEVSLKGGKATLKKHGKQHYKLMAKKRWAKSRSKAKK
jgi:hypothetical protein